MNFASRKRWAWLQNSSREQNVFRMRSTREAPIPGRSWLSVAHEFGYFDQMHMVRDFQLLGGNAPNDVLEQSGDIQPWSLAPHQALELR